MRIHPAVPDPHLEQEVLHLVQLNTGGQRHPVDVVELHVQHILLPLRDSIKLTNEKHDDEKHTNNLKLFNSYLDLLE